MPAIPDEILTFLDSATGPQIVSRETKLKLFLFVQDVLEWQNRLNLISQSSVDDIWHRHVLDSIQLFPFIRNDVEKIIDFGSGGGFPGIVLSIFLDKNITLIESISKKSTFLSIASRHAYKKNEIVNSRIEEVKNLTGDLITSRAMTSLKNIFEHALPFCKEKTYMLLHKGEKVDDEIEDAREFFLFDCEKHPSITDDGGVILEVHNLKRKKIRNGDGS